MTYAYLRASTGAQDHDGQRLSILQWAAGIGERIDQWTEETISSRTKYADREIAGLIDRLTTGDTIVTSELSRLARSMCELFSIVQAVRDRGASIVLAREGRTIGAAETIEGNAWLFAVSIGAQIERQMISERTKAALAARKAAGKPLGRPKGPGKSKLDEHRAEIVRALRFGAPIRHLARLYHVAPSTMQRYLNGRGIYAKALRASGPE